MTLSLSSVWFFSAIILIIVSLALLVYLVLIAKKKKDKKGLSKQEVIQEKKNGKRKNFLDEFLFIIGLFIFILGFIIKNWWFLAIGVVIMLFSLFILHRILIIKLKKNKEVTEKKEIELESKPLLDEDVKKVLQIMDNLLEKLPEEEIEKFSQSNDFELYKKVIGGIK